MTETAAYAHQRGLRVSGHIPAFMKAEDAVKDGGSIERGKRADLILIDGDPTQDIATIRNVALVLQDGDAYYPAELYSELGVSPFDAALKPQPAAP